MTQRRRLLQRAVAKMTKTGCVRALACWESRVAEAAAARSEQQRSVCDCVCNSTCPCSVLDDV